MPKFLIIILILIASLGARATTTVSLTYNYQNLDFSVGYNDGTHLNGVNTNWYYKGMSEQLQQYIQTKIANGELEDKKFNISIWLFPVVLYDCCPIELSQNKNGYYINILEKEPSLMNLVQIINYFASKQWKSFVCNDPKKYQDIANKTLFRRMDSIVGKPDLSFFNNKKSTVFELKKLKITYENDSLTLSIDNSIIDININHITSSVTPVYLGTYYIIATDDSLYVYDKTVIINSIARPKQEFGSSGMKAYKFWMNYYAEYSCVLSYSFKKNKFYRINQNKL